MNTPDTLTISISRGRWSVARSCDLDLLLNSKLDAADELLALFEETHHAFTDAARHLDQFALPEGGKDVSGCDV